MKKLKPDSREMASWFIYLLLLNNQALYTGITNNLNKRLDKHYSGKGSKYVRAHLPFSLVYVEEAKNRSEASKKEYAIKRMNKKQKIELISLINNILRSKKMSYPIKPLYDRVFVKKDSAEKSASGLHLPQTVKGRAVTGTVVAVGDGHLNVDGGVFVPLTLQVGDRVYVKEFTGYTIRFNDEEIFVFQEAEIIGKILNDQ